MVDGTGLENRHTRKGIGGSNPSLSAIPFKFLYLGVVHTTIHAVSRYFGRKVWSRSYPQVPEYQRSNEQQSVSLLPLSDSPKVTLTFIARSGHNSRNRWLSSLETSAYIYFCGQVKFSSAAVRRSWITAGIPSLEDLNDPRRISDRIDASLTNRMISCLGEIIRLRRRPPILASLRADSRPAFVRSRVRAA